MQGVVGKAFSLPGERLWKKKPDLRCYWFPIFIVIVLLYLDTAYSLYYQLHYHYRYSGYYCHHSINFIIMCCHKCDSHYADNDDTYDVKGDINDVKINNDNDKDIINSDIEKVEDDNINDVDDNTSNANDTSSGSSSSRMLTVMLIK